MDRVDRTRELFGSHEFILLPDGENVPASVPLKKNVVVAVSDWKLISIENLNG